MKVPDDARGTEAVFDTFKAQGVTPLALGGASTSGQHLLASLAYTKADDTWVQNYQGLKAPLDAQPYSMPRRRSRTGWPRATSPRTRPA